MLNKGEKTEHGSVKIHNQVISSIASTAAREVHGVSRIGAGPVRRLLKWAGKESVGEVKAEVRDNNEVSIKVPIIVNYGVDIPQVAGQVQENVKSAVEKMTGLSSVDIDVDVQGVEEVIVKK